MTDRKPFAPFVIVGTVDTGERLVCCALEIDPSNNPEVYKLPLSDIRFTAARQFPMLAFTWALEGREWTWEQVEYLALCGVPRRELKPFHHLYGVTS